jgi:hypothetical protein
VTENPISCDWNDINETNSAPLPKKGGLIEGKTPVKEIAGGPSVDMYAAKKQQDAADAEAAAQK